MQQLATAATAIKSTQRELAKLLSDAQSEASSNTQTRRKKRGSTEEVKEDEEHWIAVATAVEREQAADHGENDIETVRCLTGFSQDNQFVALTRKLSEALDRVETLEQALEESHAARDAAVRRTAELEKATQGLRALMLEAMRDTEQSKHRMRRAQAFYDQLGAVTGTASAEELLRLSEPPAQFEAFKVEPSHTTEIETTRARLKQANLEIARLQSHVEKLSAEKIRVRKDRARRHRDLEQLLASKHKQVLGAVRRVHYLLQQNEQYQTDLRKKDAYVSRLETKLLDMNRELNKPERASTNVHATPRARLRPERVPRASPQARRPASQRSPSGSTQVNWDAVFRQATLARGPAQDPVAAPRPPTARSAASSHVTTEDTLMDRLSQWTAPAPVPTPVQTLRISRADSETSATIASQMAADLIADSRKTFEELLAEQERDLGANEDRNENDDDYDEDEDDSLQDAWLEKLGASGF
ncbi:Hypothetical Protein FCC1311_111132 [Hondaea fermentalgiana]|uniref:Uncharacterized protein n=1 Tax=Hondaea fermentalgiana TaxID=2315210 RepID=A0A2R5GVL7_9STRA|nr:Hypothetical Protein FCC1311_111132 [Hondaea fermentalgiana]|eukprot:GBG34890.1 Hypothetical Protein FCC1311_111132 [Hondaea fermentalgiana]